MTDKDGGPAFREFAPEQVRDATTPEQMRAELFRMSRYDSLVKVVMDAANYHGSSAEDRYTHLAYCALRERNHLQATVFESAMLTPSQTIIVTDAMLAARSKP